VVWFVKSSHFVLDDIKLDEATTVMESTLFLMYVCICVCVCKSILV